MDARPPGDQQNGRLRIAVIGTGISGMSAAWLLSQRHDVTVYERDERVGGHSPYHRCRRLGRSTIPVDTGFIVYNESDLPQSRRPVRAPGGADRAARTCRLRSRSTADASNIPATISAGCLRRSAICSGPRFWSMLTDIQRFYREAPTDVTVLDELHTTLGDYLDMRSYSRAFRDDHLLPMAGAIWSAPPRHHAAPIRRHRSSAFTTITACCGSPTGRNGAR